jgi:hypothetical protein
MAFLRRSNFNAVNLGRIENPREGGAACFGKVEPETVVVAPKQGASVDKARLHKLAGVRPNRSRSNPGNLGGDIMVRQPFAGPCHHRRVRLQQMA